MINFSSFVFNKLFLYRNVKQSNMATNTSMDSFTNDDKRNIKNIYVHKINSLMKLSKDTLIKEDLEGSNKTEKKKFKKTTSSIDKNTLKLQKNRESAKKARLRKKIYIKMLESQIECFKKIKTEGDQLNEELESFLNNKNSEKKNIEMNEHITHDVNVDKFLFGPDLGEVLKIQSKEFEKKLKQRDGTIQELYQLSTSGLIKKLKGSKNLEVFQPILKPQARENMPAFYTLVKRMSHNYDCVKNSFRKLHQLTQQSKHLSRHCHHNGMEMYDLGKFTGDLVSVQKFMERLDLNRESEMIQEMGKGEMMMSEEGQHGYEIDSMGNKKINQQHGNDFNLCTTEKLLIRAEKFFQHTVFEDEQ